MPKPSSDRRPSREEFLQTIETEFAFLVEDGYSRETTPENDYKVIFTKGSYRLELAGIHYGMAATFTFTVDGKYCPIWRLLRGFRKDRKTPKSDAPQLDELREYAWWMKNELRGLFQGKPEFTEKIQGLLDAEKRQEESIERSESESKKGDFFSIADKLFKAKQYADCVHHLESGDYPLSDTWKARLEYAKKHS